MEKHQMSEHLKKLKLPGMMNNLDLRLREARENNLGHLEFFSLLVSDEVSSRETNCFQKRIRAASFEEEMVFEGFDFRFNEEAMPSALVRDLATCHFAEQNRNLVIAGPPGIGKSHVAVSIGHEMCRRGYDVLFRKTKKLLSELSMIYEKRSQRLLKNCIKTDLLILDDFALTKIDQKECEILYTIADERLGRASTILTSNRPPEDWYSIFPDPVIGGALLDRLVSGALKVITTKGRSYRKENQK